MIRLKYKETAFRIKRSAIPNKFYIENRFTGKAVLGTFEKCVKLEKINKFFKKGV